MPPNRVLPFRGVDPPVRRGNAAWTRTGVRPPPPLLHQTRGPEGTPLWPAKGAVGANRIPPALGKAPISLPKSLVGKRLARAGFEILFRFPRFSLGRYSDIRLQGDGQVGFGRIHVTPLMRLDPTPMIIRRSDVDVAIAQSKKINIPPGRAGLPSLLTELGEHVYP